ncbi:MAG: RnfABCDGE type electron transport complex subunit G [Azoarcus sp.]|jgi:electron transport complex protein RnfG|nr:RnfABCDGE type electron transport complex subunit G [Azoarcus sp.]
MTFPDPALPESPPPPSTPTGLPLALRRALVSAFSLFAFTLPFTALMAFTYEVTHDRIKAAENQKKMSLIEEVLPNLDYDNDLLSDVTEAEDGEGRVGNVWRARKGGAPVALVFETFAPDGYGGRIDLIVSLDTEGRIGGVRVTAHKETPGLGDYIDPGKDRNKEKPWIGQFTGANPSMPAARWEVKKDGGDFDYPAGATVSARAVTRAVGRAAAWVDAHHETLFTAPPKEQKD